MFPEIPGDIFFGHMEMSGEIVQRNAKTVILLNIGNYFFLKTVGVFGWAGLNQFWFAQRRHKFQEKNGGARRVLESVFWVTGIRAGVGVVD